LSSWLRRFIPEPLSVSRREMLLGCVGAGLGLVATEWFSRLALGTLDPWFLAPMGASAVLLFAVPASPLAQPWPLIGGNTVSALVGVSCGLLLGHTGLAAGVAGLLAIGAMLALRCLHPPGGAVAVTAVLGGATITSLGYRFALWPVAVNSAVMLLVALVFNHLAGRHYPHQPGAQPHHTRDPLPSHRLGFTHDDLQRALQRQGALLDISAQDKPGFTPFMKTTPDGAEVWFSHKLADAVSCRSTQGGFDLIDTVPLGMGARPNHVEFVRNARGSVVYASLARIDDGGPGGVASSPIAIIDRSAPGGQRKVVGTFSSRGRESHGLWTNPENTLLYVAHEQDELPGTPNAGQTVCSAFDVSDPLRPTFIAQIPLGNLTLPSGALRNKKSINLVYVRVGEKGQTA